MILTNQVNVDPELKIGKYGVNYLLKRAAQILEAKSKGSDLFDEEAENEFPRFNTSGECTPLLYDTYIYKYINRDLFHLTCRFSLFIFYDECIQS